jgi:hypothetical protein
VVGNGLDDGVPGSRGKACLGKKMKLQHTSFCVVSKTIPKKKKQSHAVQYEV